MKLQQDEEIIHEMRPGRAILVIWFFSKGLTFAAAGGFLAFWVVMVTTGLFVAGTGSDLPFPGAYVVVALPVVVLVFLIIGLIYSVLLRRTYVYYVTNQRCVFHGGILRRVERSVPYHKVTDVEMSQNIFERVLGISKLNIFTPGTASVMAMPFGGQRAEISFVGVTDSETPAAAINGILRTFRATGE